MRCAQAHAHEHGLLQSLLSRAEDTPHSMRPSRPTWGPTSVSVSFPVLYTCAICKG